MVAWAKSATGFADEVRVWQKPAAAVEAKASAAGFMPAAIASGMTIYVQHSAAGVVAAVAPWNYPLMLETWKVAPALAWGNTVVLKPAEDTPHSAFLLAKLALEAGIPDGVLNVVHGFGPDSAGEALTVNPAVDRITFTGESGTGRAIARAAAANLTPVSDGPRGSPRRVEVPVSEFVDSPEVVKAAEALAEAARTGVACPPIRSLFAAGDVNAAYAVQRRNIAARVAAGRRIVGRKIGLTNPVVQVQLGVDQPDFGALFDDTSVPDGGVVAPGRLLQARVEAEVALVLAEDMPLTGYTADDVRAATRYALPSLEIVDSRVAGWDIGFVETVADNASAGMYVVGTPVPLGSLDLRAVRMSMTRNGEVVSSGTGAQCLDDPLIAAAWLANTLSSFGDPLRAGDVVLTGALGPVVPALPGDVFAATISGLGDVSVHFGGRS